MPQDIIASCEAKSLRMTGQCRVVAQPLDAAEALPNVEKLRASALDCGISLAAVPRTVKHAKRTGDLEFADGRAHHDHLIGLHSGTVIAFMDPETEAPQERIAARLGFRRMGRRMEVYRLPFRKIDE